MGIEYTVKAFESIGGEFITPPLKILEKLAGVRAVLFDWDGVFNTGEKSGKKGSTFTEQDSMGINMLRLGLWLRDDQRMPVTGIITGATNKVALTFAKRESFDVCIRGYVNKRIAWAEFQKKFDVRPDEVAFVFDDILDLPIAMDCGLRICIRRDSSPAFKSYLVEEDICDYLTGSAGGSGGVREATEMLLSLMGMYEGAIKTRVAYSDVYEKYQSERRSVKLFSMSPD